MLNINDIGLMLYQPLQVATLDFITQIVPFFSSSSSSSFPTNQVSAPHARSRS